MKKKEFQKPSIKLVKMEQNISILAGSGEPAGIMSYSITPYHKKNNITFDR